MDNARLALVDARRREVDGAGPGNVLATLKPADRIASTTLPGCFHRDPADRILAAIARRLDVALGIPESAATAVY